MEDRCICCGEIVPEGRQVCPGCETGGIKMTQEEIVKNLRISCRDCNPAPCCEYEVLGSEAADLIETLTARAEKAEAELKEAVADIEELLGQEDYLGVCWACAKDCKKGDKCVPKWRGAREEGEKCLG